MRSIACLLLVALASASVWGRTLAEIQSSRELRICVTGTSADYYRANGEDFARYLGVQPTTKTLEKWDQQFHNAQGTTVQDDRYEAAPLASGQCDLYPNDLHITDWRQKKMTLVPYFVTRNVVVARPEMRGSLRAQDDLRGRIAAVQAGTAYEGWLRGLNATAAASHAVVIQNAPTAQSMQAVAQRRADFTVIAAESAFHWVRNDPQNLDMLFPVGEATQAGWGLSPRAPDLQQALQRYFDENRRVGSALDQSWRGKYGVSLMEYQLFSESFDTSRKWHQAWMTWGIPGAAALGGVLFAMLFWATRLRREMARHKVTLKALQESHDLLTCETHRRKAVAELLLELQQVDTLPAFARTVLGAMARNLPVGQALMVLVKDEQSIEALAHYAGSGASAEQTLSECGKTVGMIERCIATRQAVTIENPGADYLRIESGLGHCAPATIHLMPVRHAGRVTAVIELALTQALQQEHRQLLADMEPIVAVGIQRFVPEETSTASPFSPPAQETQA